MAARKKQEEEINLLPQKGFQTSTAGRILAWILSTFRIIVIVTEMIVMVAFLSRFWFDAQNTDLNDKIQDKQRVLQASLDFENKFKDVQKRLEVFSGLTKNQVLRSEVLTTLKNHLPPDIIVTQILVENDEVQITGITPNERSIQQFIINLASNQSFADVGLAEVKTTPENSAVVSFTINAKFSGGKGV